MESTKIQTKNEQCNVDRVKQSISDFSVPSIEYPELLRSICFLKDNTLAFSLFKTFYDKCIELGIRYPLNHSFSHKKNWLLFITAINNGQLEILRFIYAKYMEYTYDGLEKFLLVDKSLNNSINPYACYQYFKDASQKGHVNILEQLFTWYLVDNTIDFTFWDIFGHKDKEYTKLVETNGVLTVLYKYFPKTNLHRYGNFLDRAINNGRPEFLYELFSLQPVVEYTLSNGTHNLILRRIISMYLDEKYPFQRKHALTALENIISAMPDFYNITQQLPIFNYIKNEIPPEILEILESSILVKCAGKIV